MKKPLTWMSTYGPALIPAVGLALVLGGIAIGVCDPVVGGLILSSLLSLGEAITYTMLALSSDKAGHARPYSFIAGTNWTTTIVLVMLLLATLGFWTPIPTMTHAENGLSPRSHERSKAIAEIAGHPRHKASQEADAPKNAVRDVSADMTAASAGGAAAGNGPNKEAQASRLSDAIPIGVVIP